MVYDPINHSLLENLASKFQKNENIEQIEQSDENSNSMFDIDLWLKRHVPDAEGPYPWKDVHRRWQSQCLIRPSDGKKLYIIQHNNGALSAKCHHNTCPWSWTTGNHWHDLREYFEGPIIRISKFLNSNLDMELAELPRTEYGLADRFCKRYGKITKFIETWGGKWLVFDGQRWRQSDCAAELHAQDTIHALRREAWYLKDEENENIEENEEETESTAHEICDGVPESSSDPEHDEPCE